MRHAHSMVVLVRLERSSYTLDETAFMSLYMGAKRVESGKTNWGYTRGGGCALFMHSRSRMTIRPSQPYNAGTEQGQGRRGGGLGPTAPLMLTQLKNATQKQQNLTCRSRHKVFYGGGAVRPGEKPKYRKKDSKFQNNKNASKHRYRRFERRGRYRRCLLVGHVNERLAYPRHFKHHLPRR